MALAKNLKKMREAKSLSQADLANKTGLSLGAIRCYEQGLRQPLVDAAVKLAKALGVTVEQLVADGEPPAKKGKQK